MSSIISGTAGYPLRPSAAGSFHVHSLRVGVLLGAIAILNGIDLVYTLFAENIGMLHEMNPITAAFLQRGLYGGAACFKILTVAAGIGILWRLRHHRLTLPVCWVLLITYVWLGTVWVQWVRLITDTLEAGLNVKMF
jgi:hypothetical protein